METEHGDIGVGTVMEIYPFTKIAWRSEKIRVEWEPIQRRIYDATYFAELFSPFGL